MNAMSSEKTSIQKTLIDMRRRLNVTQQQLAARLKITTVTVGRWESTRSPTGSSLTQLAAFAAQVGDTKSAEIFRAAAMPRADVDAFQAYKLAQAAAKALEQIRVAA